MTTKKREPGGRAAKGYAQITFRIPEPLKRRFKAAAVLKGRDMSEIIEELLTEYLDREREAS